MTDSNERQVFEQRMFHGEFYDVVAVRDLVVGDVSPGGARVEEVRHVHTRWIVFMRTPDDRLVTQVFWSGDITGPVLSQRPFRQQSQRQRIRLEVSCVRCGLIVSGVSPDYHEAFARMMQNFRSHQNGMRCLLRGQSFNAAVKEMMIATLQHNRYRL